jgi:ABC-type cobalamin transport system ATPase subunit
MQGSAGKPWVLVGPDGIGKSALAAAYAKRYAGDHDVLWRRPGEGLGDGMKEPKFLCRST